MYTSSTIMNFILEGKIYFTETEWKCKTSLPVLELWTYLDNFLLECAGKLVLLAPLGGATGSLSSDLALSKVFTEPFNF